ncbi:hypothetical protein NHP21005_13830 [Helicobacter sp. NHP21005]|nr:hypothetical protein NHP21005_13830 [Helicobacter sp. NHP21005]
MQQDFLFENAPQGALAGKIEALKKLFPSCVDKEGKVILEKLGALLGQNGGFSSESYGLQWLGKAYARMLAEERPFSMLELEQNAPSQNLLIRGDNLEALKHLQHAYYEKIKCIYIDPPYNTGNDAFIYQDKRAFSPQDLGVKAGMSEGEAGRVLEFIAQGANTHSAWLTFMYPRLVLARHLLRDDGAIFISIDDNEQAPLKLLCDEVFGEGNFVGNLVWQKKKGGGGSDSQYFLQEHEYILCYAKTDWTIQNLIGEHDESTFKKIINGKKAKIRKLEKDGDKSLRIDRPSLYYPIKDPQGNDFYPLAPSGEEGRWRKKPENLDPECIFWQKDSKGRLTPYEVLYFDEVQDQDKIIKTRTIFTEHGTTTEATKEIQALFGLKIFDTPKPTALIQKSYKLPLRGGGEPRDCPRLFCRLRDDRACRDGAKPRRWGQAAIYFNPAR